MRVAILSDVHANYVALKAVVDHMERQGYDRVWFLGDAFGRGPEPIKTWGMLRSLEPGVWLAGNWDRGITHRLRNTDNVHIFAPHWWEALEWQREMLMLGDEHVEIFGFLDSRPVIAIPHARFHVAHGMFDPENEFPSINTYILPTTPIDEVTAMWETWQIFISEVASGERGRLPPHVRSYVNEILPPLALFFGHTHVPTLWLFDEDNRCRLVPVRPGEWYEVSASHKWLVNVGSAGNPRDSQCLSYILLEENRRQSARFVFFYVWYDTEKVRRQILDYYPFDLRELVLRAFIGEGLQNCSQGVQER